MKANNLTISIPYKGCDKNCKYCVSKITGSIKTNRGQMFCNLHKVINLARMSQVSSVLLTGKGEPFLNFKDVIIFLGAFREFPLEIQTNGLWLSHHLNRLPTLAESGLNVIALSMDECSQETQDRVKKLSEATHKAGMILRVTFNVTNKQALSSFRTLLNMCKTFNVDQLTLRNVMTPHHSSETAQSRWIKDNVDPKLYPKLGQEMRDMCNEKGHHIRSLPYGAEVYDLEGIAVSFSNYCLQDDNNTEDIRSLIFQEDGHVYSSWNSKASILF
jgi:molybdenum cofactor biosynthesis enzyme MoaA